MNERKRIDEEKRTVEAMMRLFCLNCHGNAYLCYNCQELLDYALARLDRCPQSSSKPTCAKCSIHCFRHEMRERIRAVMKYAGPRMLLHHPIMAIRHLWRETKKI